MMAEVDRWSIDKLDSSNWVTWKFQIKLPLFAKELCGLVEGMEALEEDASPQQQTERCQKAFISMVMTW